MILPVNSFSPKYSIQKNSNDTNIKNVSFSKNIDDDVFDDDYSEKIEMIEYSPNDMHLIGELDGKDYNIRFIRKDLSKKKNVEIKGYYDGQKVDIKADYKDDKNHYFIGRLGDKIFDVKHRVGGLFVKDNLKGKINGKDFYAKFPSASAVDENRDLIVLLMHLSGYTLDVNGCNFGYPDSSNVSYAYFSGNVKENIDSYTLFNDIWKDPVLSGPNPFNQV